MEKIEKKKRAGKVRGHEWAPPVKWWSWETTGKPPKNKLVPETYITSLLKGQKVEVSNVFGKILLNDVC